MKKITDRQKEIMDAAMKIIADGGIQSLSTKSLAAAIGFTEAAIYRHFSSKQEIILTLLELFLEDISVVLSSIDLEETGGLEKIEKLILNRTDVFIEKPPLAAVIFADEIFVNDRKLITKVKEIMDISREYIIKWIDEDHQREIIKKNIPDNHIAHIYMASFRVQVNRWRMERFEFDLKNKVKGLIGTLKKLFKEEGKK